MMKPNFPKILSKIFPESRWTVLGDFSDYSNVNWLSPEPKPTEEEVLSIWEKKKTALAWESVRSERNRRLAASDWAMLPDAKVDKPYWENYRQALRNIPQQYATPEEVQWPQEPSK